MERSERERVRERGKKGETVHGRRDCSNVKSRHHLLSQHELIEYI